MSMAPNDPFGNDQLGSATSGQPKKGRSPWLWILAIVGGLGLIGMIVCCGLMYWGYSKGTQLAAEELKKQLVGNAVIEENIVKSAPCRSASKVRLMKLRTTRSRQSRSTTVHGIRYRRIQRLRSCSDQSGSQWSNGSSRISHGRRLASPNPVGRSPIPTRHVGHGGTNGL